ncbi:MAG: HAD-IA family hydrolase [Candidatus Methylomirabilales bacterium]
MISSREDTRKDEHAGLTAVFLKEKVPLAVLSNGTPKMLRTGLERTGLRLHFRWVISADAVKRYKPSPQVYQLAPKHMRLHKGEILFVSSNSFDVVGAKSFGFRVCWINRAGAPLDPLGPKPDLVVKRFDDLVGTLYEGVSGEKLDTSLHL